ncbi:MAG: YadA-like family protein [Stenotrophomonas sp.]|nr:YadA-like family protein [Stenotrophomonas sp.]
MNHSICRPRRHVKPLLLAGVAAAVCTAIPTASATTFTGCRPDELGVIHCVPLYGHVSNGVPTHASATGNSSDFLIIGAGGFIDGQNATVFGNLGASHGDWSAVFGHQARSMQGYSAVFGARAAADGLGATAIGQNSSAHGDNAVAVGSGAGTAHGAGTDRIAIGANAHAGSTGITGAIALGGAARAEHDSVAIGFEAKSPAANAVALGRGALASEHNTVSVGNATTQRRVVNVADARLGANSSDAVTGRQLHATNRNVSTATSTANTAKSTADTALARASQANDLISQTGTDGPIRLGGGTAGGVLDLRNQAGGIRRITGVADGALASSSNDAVSGRQLYASNQVLDSHGQVLVAHGQTLTVHSGLLQVHDRRIGDNRRDIDELRGDLDAFDPDLDGVVKFNADRSVIDASGARIQGVAAGDISTANGTDAVNGGQLFATNQRVQRIEEQGRFIRVGSDAFSTPAKAGAAGVAVGDGAEASLNYEGATAIGFSAKAYGKNSVALGRGSHVVEEAEDGFALGATSGVAAKGGIALGAGSQTEKGAINAVAVGSGSIASEADTVSFGNNLLQRRLVNIAPGTAQGDATTVAQLGGALAGLGGGAGIDPAGSVVAPTYTVQGDIHRNVGDALSALDGAVVTHGSRVQRIEQQLGSVFQGAPRLATGRAGQLDLAGSQGMVLGNLAAGRIAAGSRDAVNGGQLHEMRQQLDGRMDGLEQRLPAPDAQPRIARESLPEAAPAPAPPALSPEVPKDSPQVASSGAAPPPVPQADPPATVDTRQLDELLERANRYTEQATAGIERRLDKMDRRFNRMAAMNTAQSAMAMNTAGLATHNRLGAGIGHAEGEAAMAVGYQRVLNERGSSTVSLHGAFTNSGERGVGVGLGIGW